MKTYDILLFKNQVYIGMENVSTTYKQVEKKTNLSKEEIKLVLIQAFEDWNNDEIVIKEKKDIENGNPPYYPNQYKTPCLAIICEDGKLDNSRICEYRDIVDARNKGAKDIFFSNGLDDVLDYLDW
jgi:hypothetical protein